MASPPNLTNHPDREAEKTRLGEFLATGPLYTPYAVSAEISQFPFAIRLLCAGECQKEQTFECDHRHTGRGSSNDRGWGELVAFHCRNCQKQHQKYWYVWTEKCFFKVGQLPELLEVIDPKLNAALGESRALYKKAVRSRSFGFGMGALSYLRRIIEDTTDKLMDLLREDKWHSWTQQERDEFDTARKTYQYSQKISYAALKILPPTVFASGKDSFATLHDVTSSGLHGKTEEECIQLFDECNLIFAHSFRLLHQHKQEREEFTAQLRALKR